jgi:hypothetical protein
MLLLFYHVIYVTFRKYLYTGKYKKVKAFIIANVIQEYFAGGICAVIIDVYR